MNYQGLKTMIEGLIQSHKCPDCKSNINESCVDIIGAAGTNVNIDIECPSCKKHSMVKTQLIHMNLGNISELKDKLLKTGALKRNNTKIINDKEITNLSRDLKNLKISAEDLFSGK